MIHAEQSIVIDRPIEAVFDFVADQRNAPKWQSHLLEVRRLTDGPPGVGTKHSLVRTFIGRTMEASNEYTAYEPGRRIAFRSTSGPMRFEASYELEPTPTGTRVTSLIDMYPDGVSRLMQPLINRSLKGEMTVAVRALKNLLESGGASEPTRT